MSFLRVREVIHYRAILEALSKAAADRLAHRQVRSSTCRTLHKGGAGDDVVPRTSNTALSSLTHDIPWRKLRARSIR